MALGRLLYVSGALALAMTAPMPSGASSTAEEAIVLEGDAGQEYVMTTDELTPGEAKSVGLLPVQPMTASAAGQTSYALTSSDPVKISLLRANTFPPNSPGPTNWRGCGLFDHEEQFVASYTRVRVSSRIPTSSTKATLGCGTSTWGYRHIQQRHTTDWMTQASKVPGVQWRDLAGWSMAWVLRDPDKASFGNNKFCFNRQISIYRKNDGKLVLRKQVRVILGETGRRIISAYPQDSYCGGVNLN